MLLPALWITLFAFPPLLHQLDKDDMVYMEAFDKLLESWLTLVQDEEHFPRGCFVQPAIQVFNSYIQCHLAAPDGTRNLVRLYKPFLIIKDWSSFLLHLFFGFYKIMNHSH